MPTIRRRPKTEQQYEELSNIIARYIQEKYVDKIKNIQIENTTREAPVTEPEPKPETKTEQEPESFKMLELFYLNMYNLDVLNNSDSFVYRINNINNNINLQELKSINKTKYLKYLIKEIRILYIKYKNLIESLNGTAQEVTILRGGSFFKPTNNEGITLKEKSENYVLETINVDRIEIEKGSFVMFKDLMPAFDIFKNFKDEITEYEYKKYAEEEFLCISKITINDEKELVYPFEFIILSENKDKIQNYMRIFLNSELQNINRLEPIEESNTDSNYKSAMMTHTESNTDSNYQSAMSHIDSNSETTEVTNREAQEELNKLEAEVNAEGESNPNNLLTKIGERANNNLNVVREVEQMQSN